MSKISRKYVLCLVGTVAVLTLSFLPVSALTPRTEPASLDSHVKTRAGGVVAVRTIRSSDLDPADPLRQSWDRFLASQSGGWNVWLDGRTGLPSLAAGHGIEWIPAGGPEPTLEELAAKARSFLDEHPALLGRWDGQMVLDREASGRVTPGVWEITFRQEIGGVRVEGARYDFQVSHGNLVAFGATQWGPVEVPASPSLSRDEARTALNGYLGVNRGGQGELDLDPGTLHLIPVDPRGEDGKAWDGTRGRGLAHRLVWRFAFQIPGEPATWVGEVDAHSGEVFSFFDDTRYQRVKGGVYPVSNDGICPSGCEQIDYPLPFADYSENGGAVIYTGDHGLYDCSTIGSTITTTLNGKHIKVHDNCGAVSETTLCDDDMDFQSGPGTDCQVPPGASAGDTHAARSSFYHLNRAMQKGRAWLPSNTWLQSQVTDNVNINSTCNAYWNGSVNFYKSGGGCANTGELMGVFVHEWGHGLDQNDGGGYDNPSEAYADIVATFESRESCVGRGFYLSGTCGGYGDACLDCTGIRDLDFAKHEQNTPATPSGFVQNNCGGGGGPCGKEVHCEGYVGGETLWDLANRDLPASGLDADTSWQMAEQLWYLSREGSGGDAYNCSLPSSDGCGTNSWFHKLRLVDDDDGNLNNGTPHAAAIFAAFNRHDIACGNASDASNQDSSSCPTLAAPSVTLKPLTNAVQLTWPEVAGAGAYRVLRNDIGCNRGQVIVTDVPAPATGYTDDGLANDFTVYYRVQAIGTNTACVGPVSSCVSTAPQPFAGTVKFDQATYSCNHRVGLRVNDANVGASTVTVDIWSDTEAVPETVILTETTPGSGKYDGEIYTTSDPPAADGLLSVTDGDTMTAQYIDADDGAGGTDIPRQRTALADCVMPVISNVAETNVTDVRATIQWTTNETSDTEVLWGETTPPTQTATGAGGVTQHSVDLTGLQSCTVYYYEVHSTDPAGNLAVSDNGGAWYHFETLGDLGNGLQPCHAGQVDVLTPIASCNDTVLFQTTDMDLNQDPLVAETATITVTSTTEADPETVVLTETGPNTSRFTGSINTGGGDPAPDGVLQTKDGDVLTATYRDADDGTGSPAISFDTGALDCGGPAISGLVVDTLTNVRGTVRWTTDEAADTVLEWGDTPALGQVSSNATLATSHAVTLNQSDTCRTVYFRVSGTDTYGNTTVVDEGGQPFRYHTYDIPGLYWRDNFENGVNGWTLAGEWEIGAPQGLGGSSGRADPAAAYNNTGVLGHDLSGQGSYPGDYEPLVDESASSPPQDASTWTNTKLLMYRRLNVGSGDNASLILWTDSGLPIYRNEGAPVSESSFQIYTADVSGKVDGTPSVHLEFQQRSDDSGQYSGWNVDDVIFKDGSLPDYGPCADCGASPSFAGVVSAADNDACGGTGVTVSWKQAVSWGSGGSGTYAVYRDVTPDFTPSAGNLVAAGRSGTSYNDATAPEDAQLYYLVLAESDESCGQGPNNGGLTDGAGVTVGVSNTSSRPVPGQFDTLRVRIVNGAHVRLEWNPVADASEYRIYRSVSPQPGTFGNLAATTSLFHDDQGAAANSETYYYLVHAANPCGNEGP